MQFFADARIGGSSSFGNVEQRNNAGLQLHGSGTRFGGSKDQFSTSELIADVGAGTARVPAFR
jgi:hypothetical protein